MSFKIKSNLNGSYIAIDYRNIEQGVQFALDNNIIQVQIRNYDINIKEGVEVDFKALEFLAEQLKILSLDSLYIIKNFESLHSLTNIEKIYINKQKYELDLSKFIQLKHLGLYYWSKIKNLESLSTLESIVLNGYSAKDLLELKKLTQLKSLHLYNSKTTSLKGIDSLKLKRVFLSRNKYLTDVSSLRNMESLDDLMIEKCPLLTEKYVIDSVNNACSVKVIH